VLQSTKGSRNKGIPSEKSEDQPYVLKRYLMSKAERSFFGVLEQVTDSSKHYVFPQLSLSKLVTVEKGTGFYQAFHNKVDRKSVDFVLFDRNAMSPVLAIELDDSSHDREDRQERDAFVDRVLAKAGLPLLHVRAQAAYDPKQLAASIGEAMMTNGPRQRAAQDT
jgi:very-short-patch-repair endonuclease